jgi:hypothetical protein
MHSVIHRSNGIHHSSHNRSWCDDLLTLLGRAHTYCLYAVNCGVDDIPHQCVAKQRQIYSRTLCFYGASTLMIATMIVVKLKLDVIYLILHDSV